MITDALWIDLNKDTKPDLVLCGEWMKIHCFENINGKLVDATEKYFPTSFYGWWNKLASADLDGDGDVDKNDVQIVTNARGLTPTVLDQRDVNGDGAINALDTRALTAQCTRSGCATM